MTEWYWTIGSLAVLITISLVVVMTMIYFPTRIKVTGIGGDLFHPFVTFEPDELIQVHCRASFVREAHKHEAGEVVITSRRLIFVPAGFPWEDRQPTIVSLSAIRSVDRAKLPGDTLLGPLGRLFTGLRLQTAQQEFWFGKPNIDGIESALRTRV